MKYCPNCGCPLQKTTYDRDWCPNCFKIIGKESSEEESDKRYIG